MQHKTKWTITYTSGATRLVSDEQTARTEAMSNPNVIGIRAPIYA